MFMSIIHAIKHRIARRRHRATCLHAWETQHAKTEIVKHCERCGAVRYIA